jgi:hypothetical protein
MLAAIASFALHGAAMAGAHAHRFGSAPCPAHVHQAKAHQDGDGIVHVHASRQAADVAAHQDGANADHHADADGPCCSSVCSVTLAAFGVDVISVPVGLAIALQPESRSGSGIDPNGLKRPPRTPDIA